jgi:hypothetical protein
LFFVGLVARLPGVTGWLRRGGAKQPERHDAVSVEPVVAD